MADVLGEFIIKVRKIVGNDAEIIAKMDTVEQEVRRSRGGELCYISKNVSIELRREMAIEQCKQGKSTHEIIKTTGLGRDSVRDLKKILKS